MSDPYTFEGDVGVFAVGRLRDAVEHSNFSGRKVDLWIGRGWMTKPFALRGEREDVRSILAELGAEGEMR